MTAKRTEEPAFPIGSGDMRDPTGMTLRDYFAAKVLSGLVVNGENFDLAKLTAFCYGAADAMMKARNT